MTIPTRLLRLGAASIVVALLVSCSDGGSDDAGSDTKVRRTTTTTEPMGDPELGSELSPYLVTAQDLGATFVKRTPNPSGPGPCDGKNIEAAFPSTAKAKAAFVSERLKLVMQQDLWLFESDEEASTAFAGFVDAVSCGADAIDPTVTLGEPTDVTSEVGREATAVTIKGDGVEGVGILVHHGAVVATYQFQGAAGAADAPGAPEPLDIVAANVSDIVGGIG